MTKSKFDEFTSIGKRTPILLITFGKVFFFKSKNLPTTIPCLWLSPSHSQAVPIANLSFTKLSLFGFRIELPEGNVSTAVNGVQRPAVPLGFTHDHVGGTVQLASGL